MIWAVKVDEMPFDVCVNSDMGRTSVCVVIFWGGGTTAPSGPGLPHSRGF